MSLRRAAAAGGIFLLAALVGAAGAVLVRQRALARHAVALVAARVHQRLGVRLEISDATLALPFGVRLTGVRASSGSDAELTASEVELSLRPASLLMGRPEVRRVRVVGLSMRLDDVKALRSLQAAPKGGGGSAGPSRPRSLPEVVVEGGSLRWRGRELALDGVELALVPDGQDTARWSIEGQARLVGSAAGLCAATGEVRPFGSRRVTVRVACDRPLTWESGYRDLVVRFGRFHLDAALEPGGPRLDAALDEFSVVRQATGALPEVEVFTGSAQVGLPPGGQVRLKGDVRPARGPGRVRVVGLVAPKVPEATVDLRVEGFEVARTPVAAVLPFTVLAGDLSADVAVDVRGGLDDVDVIGRVELTDVAVAHPWLAPSPVGGLRAVLDLDVSIDVPGRRVEVYRNVWTGNGLPVEVDGRFELSPPIRVKATVRSGPHTGEALALALPPALAPAITPLELEGTWAASLLVDLDAEKPKAMKLRVDLDVDGLHATRLGGVKLDRVLGRFRRHFIDPKTEEPDSYWAGPATPGWVPIEAIPWTLQMALLSQEDGGFYKHAGFSLYHVRGALARDIKEGRLVRGASTISMQTVKNVFLTPEKTLSRKIQEVILTWQLEQFLDKADILELYLNVIEWGPRLFGVAQAAEHYFAKAPEELTPLECLYLATMVPSPRFYHGQFVDGRVGGRHKRRIKRLMALMVRRGHLTPEELAEAEAMGFAPELVPYEEPEE